MTLFTTRRLNNRTVLAILRAGFALVLLLLGVACVIAIRGTRSIQSGADDLVGEELTMMRLLSDVQAQETSLAAILHEVSRNDSDRKEPEVLKTLEIAEETVARAARTAGQTSDAAVWGQLEVAVSQFTTAARKFVSHKDRSDDAFRQLLVLHNRITELVRNLIALSTDRAVQTDKNLIEWSRDLAGQSLAVLGTCFVLALIGAALIIRFTRRSIEQVEWQATELGRVSWHMLQTQEAAARRFSHELHDELGQNLAAIRTNVEALNPANFATRRADCIHLVDEAIANVRELSQLLRPVILDDFGLDAALRWLTEKFSQRTGTHVEYESNLNSRLDDELETHMFRIAQEALTNVARHSSATRVSVRVVHAESSVALTIEDNGTGLPANHQPAPASLGMVGMRARARQAGGELSVDSGKQGGVRIQVVVPARGLVHEPG
jgi:signal transduction histidine kinase